MPNEVSADGVAQRILLVRGHRVMLDVDLAALYEVETRVLNQAMRRNLNRFPADFMFELTRAEIKNISQIGISSKIYKNIRHSRNVFAFTEQGVAMLSSVLHSPRAIQVNIAIMRAFVKLRETLASHKELAEKLKELEHRIVGHDVQIMKIFDALKRLMAPPPEESKSIGFKPKQPDLSRKSHS